MVVPAGSSNRRYTFSLRGMMRLVLGIAVGLAVLRMKEAEWSDGALAAATTWIVLGLVNQIRDLWVSFRGRDDLSRDERWGWRFAIAWRICIAGFLVAYWCVELLLDLGFLFLPERQYWPDAGQSLRSGLFYLSLLIALLTTSRPTRQPRRRRYYTGLVNFLGWVSSIVLCVLLLREWTAVLWLHYLLVTGIETASSARFAREGIDMIRKDAVGRFYWTALIAAPLVVANVGLTRRLAQQWMHGLSRRLVATGWLAAGLSFTLGYSIWVYGWGLPSISLDLAEAITIGPLHRWFYALLVVGTVTTAATYQSVKSLSEPARATEHHWRNNPRRYYHERREVTAVLALALLAYLIKLSVDTATFADVPFATALEYFAFLDVFPVSYLALAVLIIALRGTLTGWHKPQHALISEPARLPLGAFIAVWLAMFLTIASGLATVAWFGFAIWLTPWWWRWPPP